jgi:concanavalin A-like lectin/glucanase superfamily protein
VSKPTRHFDGGLDSIDFGVLPLLNGLTSLAVRVCYTLDPSKSVTPFAGDEVARSWCSQWGASNVMQSFFLGQAQGDEMGSIRFNCGDGAGNIATVLSSGSQILTPSNLYAQWHELVATWVAAGTLALYLDGAPIGLATGQTTVAALPVATAHLVIGCNPGPPYNAPAGLEVNQVGFWSSLPAAVIHAFNNGNGPSSSFSGATFLGECSMGSGGGRTEPFRGPGGLVATGVVTGTRPDARPSPGGK